MMDQELKELKRRMGGALDVLGNEFAGLRTGRASVNLLDPITVESYGSRVSLNQVGAISVPEPRMIVVNVWDKSMVAAVEKAIRESNLGLNPSSDGLTVRVPIPNLSEERRKELTKVAAQYAENTRVSIRNIRRDGMELVKKMEKSSDLSQDESRKVSADIQTMTDDFIKKVDAALVQKEKDILSV